MFEEAEEPFSVQKLPDAIKWLGSTEGGDV
jgi:hypothetical protein